MIIRRRLKYSKTMNKVNKLTLPLCIELLEDRYGKNIRRDTKWLSSLLEIEMDFIVSEEELREHLGLMTVEEKEARLMYKNV